MRLCRTALIQGNVFPTLSRRHGEANQGTGRGTKNATNRSLGSGRAGSKRDEIDELLLVTWVPSGQSDCDTREQTQARATDGPPAR